jgi:hypothetical protein
LIDLLDEHEGAKSRKEALPGNQVLDTNLPFGPHVQTSIKHDVTRKRLFPAFNSLMHIEKKINHDSRFDLSQGYVTPWRLAIRCKLHASVACVERANVQTSIKHDVTRKYQARDYPEALFFVFFKLPHAHRKKDRTRFQV